MDTKKVITFGSCLSAETANILEETSSYYRLSSVQHNRIDQFMENYVYKTRVPLKAEDLHLKIKEQFSNVNVFRNQFEEVELGKALPFKRKTEDFMHPIRAIKEGIDVLIIDNYPDIFFKVYKHIEKNSKFFVNKAYLEEEPETMQFINELLDPLAAAILYKDLIEFCKKYNENLITIFINFPTNLKQNKGLDNRSQKFIEEVENINGGKRNFSIIPPWIIKEEELSNPKDPYHFTKGKYSEYAKICDEIIRKNIVKQHI